MTNALRVHRRGFLRQAAVAGCGLALHGLPSAAEVAPGATAPDEAVTFERMSFAMASKVDLDGQGRLLLNETLKKRAGLKDQVTLVGVRDHIELWNSEHWEQYLSDNMAQYQKQMAQARQTVLLKQNEDI